MSKINNNLSKSTSALNTKGPTPLGSGGYADSVYFKTAAKFTQFKASELDLFVSQFQSFDKNGDGHIDINELARVCKEIGEEVTTDELQRKMSEVGF